MQAALAAYDARARSPADTDWPRIVARYDRLRDVMPSPVVDLNRAIAQSMAFGPEVGLRLLNEMPSAAALRNYAPLPVAPRSPRNAREAAFLLAHAAACQ